jgi:predicted MFS family arabinose efflux permease
MFQSSLQLYRNAYSGLSRAMWWLSLVMFINRCGTMVIPFLTVYLTSKGYSLAQAGYVMAAFGGGSILGGYIGGRLTDRIGYYYVQFFSLLLNGILFIVLGQMQTFWQFACCIFILSSLGEAFRPANSAAIASYSNETNRTRCYSLNRLAINLGWAIGPAVGGLLASVNYALLFWADGITCILAAVLLYFVFSPGRSKKQEVTTEIKEETTNSAYRDRVFLTGMFYIFLVGLCFFQMFSTIPVYYKEQVHLNESTIGWVLAMNGLIIALVEMVMVYKLENRRNPILYMMLGALLIGVAFLTLYAAPRFTVVLCSMIFITFGEMLLFPFMNNFWVKRSTERNRGQYAAVYTMSFSAAIVLAPTFSSQVATWFGFEVLWVINFFVCTFASVGFLLLKKRMNA